MSFLGKIFGGKGGQDKPVTTGEAIQKLRETEDMLMKKQVFFKITCAQNSSMGKYMLHQVF